MQTQNLKPKKIQQLYWDDNYSLDEIACKLGVSFWSMYGFMRKNNIPRRSQSQVNFVVNKDKPGFLLNEKLDPEDEKLKIAGIMLYWAEGTLKGKTVDFSNSNPDMISIFMRFLREVCGVSEGRLRVYLYAYPGQDIERLKRFWSCVSGIGISQFTKPYIRIGNPNFSHHKLSYGLVHIRYNDKKLLGVIENWIKDFSQTFLVRAGTQVAKGGRLCKKRSVLPKGRMEK
ncbi:MAG: hypothetical protein KBA46_00925 [Candidatus Omnitrophica bacterium]|nr:hypothetical protein [Candidatus Omnitrophota bacterium]